MNHKLAIEKILEISSSLKSDTILKTCIEFLYDNFDKYSWIGIYLVKENNLILGPWKGKQATEHVKIPIGKGICGSAAKSGNTEIISDVSSDNRYLACFVSTKSEIVVPIKKDSKVIGEIDIDSNIPNAFNNKDAEFLEKIADIFAKFL